MAKQLEVTDHSRDSAGMTYVYPVVSRRAGGVSIGINLNPNNACNWRCIYCQVPDLKRGSAPPIDMAQIERELRGFVETLLHGDFMGLKGRDKSSMSRFRAMASQPRRGSFPRRLNWSAGCCAKPDWIAR